jgi:hypothetical protein
MKALAFFLCALAANAQIFTFTKDQMVKYTSQNPFDRFPDGRPKVPDALLEQLLTGKYKSSDVYSTPRTPELKKEYDEYLKKQLGKQ